MYLIVIAWMYVVVMMALAEALGPTGTVLGALVTFVLYGLLPLSIVMYLMGTPMRRKARRQKEAMEAAAATAEAAPAASAAPDGGSEPAGDAIAPVRKEP